MPSKIARPSSSLIESPTRSIVSVTEKVNRESRQLTGERGEYRCYSRVGKLNFRNVRSLDFSFIPVAL